MSKISTIYDAMLVKLGTILPSPRTRMTNPYDLSDNPIQYLKAGWGLRHDGYDRLPFEMCKRRESQTFTVVLSREVRKIETRSDSFDIASKQLLEDAKIVRDSFYSFDNAGITDAMKLDVTSVTSLQSVLGDKYNLLKIEITIVIDYFETIT